jgi:hypothetical protein
MAGGLTTMPVENNLKMMPPQETIISPLSCVQYAESEPGEETSAKKTANPAGQDLLSN